MIWAIHSKRDLQKNKRKLNTSLKYTLRTKGLWNFLILNDIFNEKFKFFFKKNVMMKFLWRVKILYKPEEIF